MLYNAATLEAQPPRTPEETARSVKLEKLAEIQECTSETLVARAMTDNKSQPVLVIRDPELWIRETNPQCFPTKEAMALNAAPA